MGAVGDEFSAYRGHLFGVAYRMLGTRADAEDVVQEAWLRYAGADTSGVADLRAWLTTVTGRLCLDHLRAAKVRREAYVGPWLPSPLVERLPDPAQVDPGERVSFRDSVSTALLLVLDALTPEQRVAFVLHDVFAVPFAEVAATLGTTTENARQLASRARRAVADGERRHTTDRARQEQVLAAFTAAAAGGDLDALLKVLAPDVVALGDGGGVGPAARRPIVGALAVARFVHGLYRRALRQGYEVRPALVNGDLGLLVRMPATGETVVTSLAVSPDGLLTGLYNQLNPVKIGLLDEF
ncbi:RNA polymerase sigma factor SigJ [Dactylosporangium aurantiacum]|uniref:RNA polymerase sigma factor SigJ n=1 Tax=Dactylosporangium aurantiacum TaxID=35754 RepID=A0A9Q9IKX6_9ACTN|nr:RNA polymerase sigma factor SigJ [Dactylosporangium aurantiacum]MDG6100671.1 RNA polymerase sigma factor SigJ [Dactylosporangium aurantiacum]UWZ55249.1 RNA polymerase sigma factor SigJ [Dactylosporangium aurantiacum]